MGPEYGYYPPPRPYYYPPRPVVVVPAPYYGRPYRPHYDRYRYEGGNGGYRSEGNYGYSRRRRD
ncbi:MAG: hypothetical protein NVSMB30_22610 [Hymenobacter sp.]